MSDKSIEARLIEELDDVLRRANEAEDVKREAERVVDSCRAAYGRLEDEAQRLRRALWSVQGVTQWNAGDVNSENHKRRTELRRGTA